jgi:hypothetical protein
MVAVAVVVAAVAVEVEVVGVMVILTMGMVVVTMATAAREAVDGNCSDDPFLALVRSARLGPLGRLDAHCVPPCSSLAQTVAVSTRAIDCFGYVTHRAP